ncbi:hypothetical protein B0I08_101150 [Glaciihabitans tibetensis]|uniref:Uncharacterized protein n=1 Tax=Glaciihabitans tibetensis TaxID=1266600 RepID=A0A2T0VIJ0_9MICO|nr:DUF1801 domain-containing protein [Glaciihabitans tibetensis]PRY70028.1 hypothetical protein B0I08_101150 [Glaciihabitans tibetensis]
MAPSAIDQYISGLEEPLASVAVTLRDHIAAALPDASGDIWQGHPVWKINARPVVGFEAEPEYVIVTFWRGQDIPDSTGSLVPSGTGRIATYRVANPAFVHGPALRTWLQQAAQLEG